MATLPDKRVHNVFDDVYDAPPNLNSANIFLRLVWGQTAKFKDRQYFRLYGTVQLSFLACSGILHDLSPLPPPPTLSSQTKGKGAGRCVTLRPAKLFACEMADLLVDHPQGLAINKIVPSYKEKFGRDLLVAQYGFPKLIRALEAIQHTIEVGWRSCNIEADFVLISTTYPV